MIMAWRFLRDPLHNRYCKQFFDKRGLQAIETNVVLPAGEQAGDIKSDLSRNLEVLSSIFRFAFSRG